MCFDLYSTRRCIYYSNYKLVNRYRYNSEHYIGSVVQIEYLKISVYIYIFKLIPHKGVSYRIAESQMADISILP